MNDIDLIYYNNHGTSFYLKRCTLNELNKIQLVFNKKAFHFSKDELIYLKESIKVSLNTLNIQLENPVCKESIVTVALKICGDEVFVELPELQALYDLVRGTLFHVNFNSNIDRLLNV